MALLYHGGFHALQLQRVAHCMWESGNITSALRIQVQNLIGQTLFARYIFMKPVPSATWRMAAFWICQAMRMHWRSSFQQQEDVHASSW